MNRRMHWENRGEGEWTRPWSQLCALHVKAEQSILWWWWKESIAKTHLDWTTPLITRKAAKEKQKFTGRNSHKEAEFHRTGSKPEYYKNTTEPSSIKKPSRNKILYFLPFVPAEINPIFLCTVFFPPLFIKWKGAHRIEGTEEWLPLAEVFEMLWSMTMKIK